MKMSGFAVCAAACMLIGACADGPDMVRVSAGSGLRIRSEPTPQASVLSIAPDGSTLAVLAYRSGSETIDGMTAPWVKVRFRSSEGWVFGGYLRRIKATYRPAKVMFSTGLYAAPTLYDLANVTSERRFPVHCGRQVLVQEELAPVGPAETGSGSMYYALAEGQQAFIDAGASLRKRRPLAAECNREMTLRLNEQIDRSICTASLDHFKGGALVSLTEKGYVNRDDPIFVLVPGGLVENLNDKLHASFRFWATSRWELMTTVAWFSGTVAENTDAACDWGCLADMDRPTCSRRCREQADAKRGSGPDEATGKFALQRRGKDWRLSFSSTTPGWNRAVVFEYNCIIPFPPDGG